MDPVVIDFTINNAIVENAGKKLLIINADIVEINKIKKPLI